MKTKKQTRSFEPSRLAATVLLTVGAIGFGAASCEQKKPDPNPETSSSTTGENAGGSKTNPDDGESEVFEKKEPQTVGPDAPALFVLSGLKGYTEPCGCTLDVMLGGIDRIAGYVTNAREKYPAVGMVHAGNLLFESDEVAEHEMPQEKAKVEVVTAGLKQMGISHTVPGHKDFALGAAYYATQLGKAGIEPLAVNLEAEGLDLSPTASMEVGGVDVRLAGVVDPTLFEETEGVSTSPAADALKKHEAELKKADVAVLLTYGEVPFAKKMLEAVEGVDFAVVGYKPRETDQTDSASDGWTLEPYDQGRYLGILKLFNAEDPKAAFANARTGSKAELEKIDAQIEHVNKSINRMPPATPGEEPEVLLTLRKRLEKLRKRRDEIKHASVKVPEQAAFHWRTVAMEPGYSPHTEIAKLREDYNLKLQELNSSVEREVPPVPEGEAAYIGSNNCAQCHKPATDFWHETSHAEALVTLQDRNKAFDQKCIGCHVVGYEKPGGSVLGKLQYDARVEVGDSTVDITKDLRHVGCESCHGPGSQHRAAPVASDGKAQHIIADPTETECTECHVPEHSPRFDFGVYVEEITGEGHARGK